MNFSKTTRGGVSKILLLCGTFLCMAALFYGCPQADTPQGTVESIRLTTTNATKTFYVGQKFSSVNIVVRATYTDGKTENISNSKCTFSIDGEEYISGQTTLDNEGRLSVTVEYSGKTANYTITVKDASEYTGPTYNDNYVGFSGWANKDRWNLANTHDPTVFKWTDGYWYMFGTDASYGNEHERATDGKHFQGKRSVDLVNWEYVPGIMDEAPDWIVDKLNEYRTQMNVDKSKLTKSEISWGFWAPCARVVEVGGTKKVRMYYSIVVDNYIKSGKKNTTANYDGSWTERAFIGVAESTNPNGGPSAWKDLGFVVCSSSDLGKDGWTREAKDNWEGYFYFNAIDPTYFIDDDGTHWMVYGSWHSGFALVQINPATGKVTKDGKTDFEMGVPWGSSAAELATNGYGKRIFSRGTSRWQPAEGPELVKYNGYYWLFFANDGLDVPYHTRVVRATDIEGPYIDIRNRDFTTVIPDEYPLPLVTHPYKFNDTDNKLGSCYGWVGISHCAIFNDGDDWYYMSQQRLPKDVQGIHASNAIMMGGVRKIVWTPSGAGDSDLWPMVLPERYGGIPDKSPVKENEIPGTWQHIDLKYDYGKMDISKKLTLSADKTMSGPLKGTWSFDEDKQQLTFTPEGGAAVTVTVARELDWEKVPRTPTIVYAGTQKNLNTTYWGKKG